jgi:drug/metabolite transporter superfamily protein YnfA
MTYLVWLIFIAAALLEVGGDAVVRSGLRGAQPWLVALGCLLLGAYGVTVNTVRWDFSRLLGVYVACFAVISVCWGRFVFQEQVPPMVWAGLGLLVAGGLLIQFAPKL